METKVFKRRWYMLGVFSYANAVGAILWMSVAAVSPTAQEYYNLSTLETNMLMLVYTILYVPMVVPSSWILDVLGLRVGIVAGSVLQCAGAWVRCLGWKPNGYTWVLIGQILTAIGQPIIMNAPPKFTAAWFSPDERATANAIASLSNSIGAGVSFIASPVMVQNDGAKLGSLYLMNAIVASVETFQAIVSFQNKPPLPPAPSSVQNRVGFRQLVGAFKNVSFDVLLLCFSIAYGGLTVLPTVLPQILVPLGYTQIEAGWLGVIFNFAGVIGGLVIGVIADRTGSLKRVLIATNILSLGTLVFFALSSRPNFLYVMGAAWSLLGLVMNALLPLSFEAAADMTYPLPDGAVGGILMSCAEAVASLLQFVLAAINRIDLVSWTFVGMMGIACLLLLLLFRPVFARSELDARTPLLGKEASTPSAVGTTAPINP